MAPTSLLTQFYVLCLNKNEKQNQNLQKHKNENTNKQKSKIIKKSQNKTK